MNLPLISHEMPHSLAIAAQNGDYKIDDYLFILLHRYISDERYRSIVDNYSGFTILDNSCFELGEALSDELIVEYVEKIKPSVFVLPDTLGDMHKTISRSINFVEKYPGLAPKAMAVIQGNSYEEFEECYMKFDDELYDIAMIGIPFCFNWGFEYNLSPLEHAMERVYLIDHLVDNNIIRKTTKHHLLGTWCAAEFEYLKKYDFIYSVDTSNPIAAGIEHNRYPITHKPKIKFDDFVNMELNELDISTIMYNVDEFRKGVKR